MAVFQPPPTSFPVDAFQQLVPRLIAVLQAIQNDDAQTDEPRHRLAVAAATEELKKAIADAKTLVDTLPGGQMLLTDQDAVIAALESLKARKEEHLREFARLQADLDTSKALEAAPETTGSSSSDMQS